MINELGTNTHRAAGRQWMRRIFWSVVGVWNALLVAGLISVAVNGSQPHVSSGTRHIVVTILVWAILLGDLALVTAALMSRSLKRRTHRRTESP